MKTYNSVAILGLLMSVTPLVACKQNDAAAVVNKEKAATPKLLQIEFANLIKDGESINATGVLVDDLGTFATVALHKANPEKATIRDTKGNAVALKILAHDKISRLTLFELPKAYRAGVVKLTNFANSRKISAGDALLANIENKEDVSRMVSYVRKFNGRVLPMTFIRANTLNKNVKAGSPVLNAAGELVGLTYQPTVDKESFYILPVEVIPHLQAAAKFGVLFKPCWIGVSMDHLSDAPRIIGVRPDTPAKNAGLKKGDVITSIDGVDVKSYPEVVTAFYFLQREKPTVFKVIRGVDLLELTVTPAVNPILK